jgi:hypothetical protein
MRTERDVPHARYRPERFNGQAAAYERSDMSKQPIIVFDVNETLLDLDTLHPTCDRIPFTDIGAAVLRMLAATRDVTVGDADPLGVGPQPDYIGKDLDAIAGQLIDKYGPATRQ